MVEHYIMTTKAKAAKVAAAQASAECVLREAPLIPGSLVGAGAVGRLVLNASTVILPIAMSLILWFKTA